MEDDGAFIRRHLMRKQNAKQWRQNATAMIDMATAF
jgi:hypothetical protein